MMNRNVRSVLLVDDDEDEFDLVSEAIREIDPDISVSFLNRCEEGSNCLKESFDLVLLDINMPNHDGFFWLKDIREKGYESLPVIMYTNSRSPAHIHQAYTEGANLYFTKPESYPSLKKGLKELLHLDWSNPFSITKQHLQNGKFIAFQFK